MNKKIENLKSLILSINMLEKKHLISMKVLKNIVNPKIIIELIIKLKIKILVTLNFFMIIKV